MTDNTMKISNEPLLTLAMMGFLLQEIQRGNIDALLRQGVSGRVIDQLRGLDAQQMIVLCESKKPLFGITICTNAIASTLNNIGVIHNHADLQSYFITNGATLEMMREYFKVSRTTAQKMRLNLCEESALDMRRPSEEEHLQILAAWHELAHLPRECERYKALHLKLNARFNLRALHRVINRACRPQIQASTWANSRSPTGAQEQRL